MGFSRKRKSKTKGIRWLAVAHLDGQQVPLGTYDNKELADDAWQHAETQDRRRTGGSSVLASRMTFAELVQEYFSSAGLEATTRQSYRSHCRASLLPEFGEQAIGDISVSQIGRWQNEMIAARVTARTRLNRRVTLSSILQFAVNNGWLSFNPVKATVAPKRAPMLRRRPVLTPEQWPTLRREFNEYGPETQLFVDLAIDTGLRYGEQADLRRGHVVTRRGKTHLTVETVVVWPGESNSSNGDVVERKFYTKGVDDRRVSLSDSVAERLQAHIERHRLGPEDLLFHQDRLRQEHAAWRAARDEEKQVSWAMEWEARLAAVPPPEGRFVTVLPDGRTRSGAHGNPNTFSLGCRCDHCRFANTQYQRQRRAARRQGEPVRRGPAPRGRPDLREPWVSPQWWGEIVWRPARDRAKFSWLHWHDLRHAHATWMLAAGEDIRKIMLRLGHKNLATTEIYLGLLENPDDVTAFMGRYYEAFQAMERGELAAEPMLEQSAAAPSEDELAGLLGTLPPERVAALLTQLLSR